MPQLGETVAEGKISKWFVSAGDAVKPGDNLFEIETDKVSMEVPAISAGTLAAIHVQAGEVAPVGAVVAIIQGKGETARAEQAARSAHPRESGDPGPGQERTGSPLARDERTWQAPQSTPPPDGALPRSALARAQLRPGAACRRHGGHAARAPARGRSRHRSRQTSRAPARTAASWRPTSSTARKAPALAPAPSMASIVLTADVALGQSLALCADVKAIELADVIVKAWATALRRAMPDAGADIALAAADAPRLIRDAASSSLTAIAAARRETTAAEAQRASSALFIAHARHRIRRARGPSAADHDAEHRFAPPRSDRGAGRLGRVRRHGDRDAGLRFDRGRRLAAPRLLSAFKGFVERPVTMIV